MNNTILTSILKEYEKKRLLAEKDLEKRKNKLYSENIRLEEIDNELSKIGIATAKSLIMSNSAEVLEDLNKKVDILKYEKSEILKKLNLHSDYLLPNYSCKQCNDTGYITKDYNSTMCNCLKQEIFNVEYNKCLGYIIPEYSLLPAHPLREIPYRQWQSPAPLFAHLFS